ncbi:MAG: Bug family tripartite tricarboxylate transporter substrate binding protein [Xanthobacteraceae bacterium]
MYDRPNAIALHLATPLNALIRLAIAAIMGFGCHAAMAAEPYPTKPIRVVVTFPPGGQTDVVARLIQPHLEARLGQPVVVENRPGAGGTIGVDAVAKAAPDGHFIGVGPMGALTVNMSLQEKMPYDTLKDLAPISLLTSTPFVLAAPLSFAASHVGEVIALAKTDAGNLSIGHGGNGSAMHLTALLFNHMAGVNIALVPYRGSGPALNDVVAGHIPLAVGDTTSALAVLRTGKVKALGVSSRRRDPSLPDVPTFAESGLPGFESMGWFGMLAPAGTPPEIIATLNGAIVSALKDPATVERLRAIGADPAPSTPAEFGQFIRREIDKWARVTAQSGFKAN